MLLLLLLESKSGFVFRLCWAVRQPNCLFFKKIGGGTQMIIKCSSKLSFIFTFNTLISLKVNKDRPQIKFTYLPHLPGVHKSASQDAWAKNVKCSLYHLPILKYLFQIEPLTFNFNAYFFKGQARMYSALRFKSNTFGAMFAQVLKAFLLLIKFSFCRLDLACRICLVFVYSNTKFSADWS